ncbi:KEOPS complex subunit Cgi121 [Methanobacterium oryzae]|uniref:KEOPS complex subunit Cgi121 n=1 Tax=Methanobacterium oryzae TaxID=69540 RepID=UPI003D225D39
MKSNEYNIQITGFTHNIKDFRGLINKTNEISKDCTLQLLNADGIAGYEHILHATVHAIKAFERGENIAKDLGLEICLRASAQRQISKALDILGINEGEMNICAVAVDCREDIIIKLESLLDKRGNNILESNEKILKKIYDISDEELKTSGNIENVMIERTSLLILEA